MPKEGHLKRVNKANVADQALKFVQEHKEYLLEWPAQAVSQVGPCGGQTWPSLALS